MPTRRASSTLVMRPSVLQLLENLPIDGVESREHDRLPWLRAAHPMAKRRPR